MTNDSFSQMKIALIGAGNVAACLGPRLKEAGYDITMVFSRTVQSARTLAERLDVPYTTSLKASPQSDVCIVMLKDDALAELASDIVDSLGNALYLHTAGSLPMDM
ncbi:MAG: NAD(P)-binding domain-containing protein, partial [Bacteroidaceae bacterium]